MSLERVSNFFTYIFQKFTKMFKRDHKPEYLKVMEEDDDKLEYVRLTDDSPSIFVMVRD